MKLGYNLNLKQTQKLSMTPQLQQAIKLLQFNSFELNEYIKEQIQENPLLEIESNREEIKSKDLEIEKEREIEIDWKEYIEKYDDISYKPQIDKNKEEIKYENFVTYTPSLKEALLEQLGVLHVDEEIRFISGYIIENLDENGYLKINLSEISSLLNMNIEIIEKALKTVQTLEPTGVGASDLKECLLLQIQERGVNGLIEKIIKNHLEDLGLNKVVKISKELKVDINRVQEAIDYIKTLEPKPGRGFNNKNLESTKYITPEASIELIDGEYKVVLTESAGPRLNISSFYKELIAKSSDERATAFMTEKLNSATWMIKSIEQRRNTIKKVVESILKYQKKFFTDGEKALKPLTLKMIAEDIEMHESTISRTTNGKYVQTPRGIFELKYFFTTAVVTSDGDISSTSIKSLIGDLIEGENLKKPYSDQKIADILKAKGKTISRRTVAKYRDEMGIPSSTMRKRFD
ncbi:RNA polymerase sigma-54 factor [Tissierella creatinophila DSM 6911]|uniref:RNA polymerase sigma-54 factor n=2 Tax=Tissierella creatinophila TaxID=79681 RepID=A0A1U7M942_TISCR|nr:RNA polymerase sigma-54 factor [Tissierella creatinophila DSM 6911]